MKVLFFLFLLSFPLFASVTSLSESSKVEQEVLLGRLNGRMEQSIQKALNLSIYQLNKKGYSREAQVIQFEWQNRMRFQFERWGEPQRDIGDHADQILSQWMIDTYYKIEGLLGAKLAAEIHATALLIFSATPPIIFRPCTFDMNGVSGERVDEYKRNFAKGSKFYGGFSETAFFATLIACDGLSSGAMTLLCGSISDVAERLVAAFVAPRLGETIYNKICD